MAIGAIISLVAALVGLAGIGIVVWVIGGKIKFPKGKRITAKYGDLTLHLIYSPGSTVGLDRNEFAQWINYVHWLVRKAFTIDNLYKADAFKKCQEIIVYILSEAEYETIGNAKLVNTWTHSAAFLNKVTRYIFGESVPLICFKDEYVQHVWAAGEPIIHELCHAYLGDYVGDDDDHKAALIWAHVGGKDSVQAKVGAAVKEVAASRTASAD